MKIDEFIDIIISELEIEEENINLQTKFGDLDEWDSMGAIILMGLVAREFEVNMDAKDVESLTDFQSLVDRIGMRKFV